MRYKKKYQLGGPGDKTKVSLPANKVEQNKYFRFIDKDFTLLDEIDFREKYGISKHKYRMETDPSYLADVKRSSDITSDKFGSIKQKIDVNPNTLWMSPQQTIPELQNAVSNYHNNIISSVTPIPFIGTSPRLTNSFKLTNVLDDVMPSIKWYDKFHMGKLKNSIPENAGEYIQRGVGDEAAIQDLLSTGVVRNKQSAGLSSKSRWGETVYWDKTNSPLPGNKYQIIAKNSDDLLKRPVTYDDIVDIKVKSPEGYSSYPGWEDVFNPPTSNIDKYNMWLKSSKQEFKTGGWLDNL